MRLPSGDGRFLMKPAGTGLEEMTPDNIITVDRDGQRVDGSMPCHNQVFIHSDILRARPDIVAVVHTHPPHAVAFSSLGRPLLPVGNDGSIFSAGASGPKLLADGDDLRQKSRRANRTDLHMNVFNYLVRRWHRTACVARMIRPAATARAHRQSTLH